MLRFMRRQARGLLIKTLFALIIIVFIFWGIGSFRGREKVIAKIEGKSITLGEYEENLRKLSRVFARKGEIDERELKEKALNDLIEKYLLVAFAEKIGIKISEEEFIEYLSKHELFEKERNLERKRILEILKRNNIDPKIFEEKEKLNLLALKAAKIIMDNVLLDETELQEEYKKEKGLVELSYMVFDPKTFEDKISIEKAELESIYEREKERYKEEDLYRLKYIVVDENGPLKEDKAYLDLLREKDIERYGKSKGLKVFDTGFLTEREIKERFKNLKVEEAIRDLRKGEISLPLREGGRFYIFELTDFEKGKPLKKEVAIKLIESRLRKERAALLARAEAEEALEKGEYSWRGNTGFIQRNSTFIKGIGEIPEEGRGILKLNERDRVFKKPLFIGGKYYIFSFKGEREPEREMWEKEKNIFREVFLQAKREEYLKKFLMELRKKMEIKISKEEIS